MHNDSESGFLSRLRNNETLRRLTGGRPELLIFGAPVLAIAVIVVAVIAVTMSGGGSGEKNARAAATPTGSPAVARTATALGANTPGANAGLKTPIPFSQGNALSEADLSARGTGEPGRGDFPGSRLVIDKLKINAPFSNKFVGEDGQMPNPDGPSDVAYYDFSDWPGLGGVPGKGGNVVLAGHVDYINYGPAVFWRLHELEPGDSIEIQLADGSSQKYRVEFNKQIQVGDADWTGIVQATADESITLITCGGQFEAGHYSNRQIVWGRRV